jgi:hypothetical protein
MMVKNCQTYNQIILPIALASICGLFKFKSSNALLDPEARRELLLHHTKHHVLLKQPPLQIQ